MGNFENPRSRQVTQALLKRYPRLLSEVPPSAQYQDHTLALVSINQDPTVLEFVPDTVQDKYPILARTALQRDPTTCLFLQGQFADAFRRVIENVLIQCRQ